MTDAERRELMEACDWLLGRCEDEWDGFHKRDIGPISLLARFVRATLADQQHDPIGQLDKIIEVGSAAGFDIRPNTNPPCGGLTVYGLVKEMAEKLAATQWTSEPPKVAGWYWRRSLGVLEAVELKPDGWIHGRGFASSLGGEWAGPITPPGDKP